VTSTGETIQLALAIADVFSGSIDFESDLQPGDNFEAVFEKATREGAFAGYGPILRRGSSPKAESIARFGGRTRRPASLITTMRTDAR
jgi:hypothetical protein